MLANGFASGAVVTPPTGGGGSETTSPSETSPTNSPTQPPKETPSPQIEGVLIAVFNGTNETGLAAEVQQILEADGYVAAQDPADADPKPVPKTIVYFRGGADAAQNRSNARYIADTYFEGARVSLLDPGAGGGHRRRRAGDHHRGRRLRRSPRRHRRRLAPRRRLVPQLPEHVVPAVLPLPG